MVIIKHFPVVISLRSSRRSTLYCEIVFKRFAGLGETVFARGRWDGRRIPGGPSLRESAHTTAPPRDHSSSIKLRHGRGPTWRRRGCGQRETRVHTYASACGARLHARTAWRLAQRKKARKISQVSSFFFNLGALPDVDLRRHRF